MKHSTFRTILVSVVFIGILSFAFLNSIFNVVKDIKSGENRAMAAKPIMYLQHLDQYPDQYDKYYNDNFSFRSRLIKGLNYIYIKCFHKSPPITNKIIIGNNDWLYMGGNEIDTYSGNHRFTPSELKIIKEEFEYRQKYLESRSIKYYVMIAPVKAIIYPENIPNTVFRKNNQSWGEQINEYLEKNSSVKPISVYSILKKEKQSQVLYFKLDNHWNQIGAFYATNEILKRIHTDFPSVNQLNLKDFNIKSVEKDDGNIANQLFDTPLFKDVDYALEPYKGFKSKEVDPVGYPVVPGFPYAFEYEKDREIPGSKQPKILVISDSFGGAVFPLLSEQFSRSVKIFDAWQYKLNEDIIEKEKPDIVILITLEANIRNMFGFLSNK
jgi:hypothetical protein